MYNWEFYYIFQIYIDPSSLFTDFVQDLYKVCYTSIRYALALDINGDHRVGNIHISKALYDSNIEND